MFTLLKIRWFIHSFSRTLRLDSMRQAVALLQSLKRATKRPHSVLSRKATDAVIIRLGHKDLQWTDPRVHGQMLNDMVGFLVELKEEVAVKALINVAAGRPAVPGAPLNPDVHWQVAARNGLVAFGSLAVELLLDALRADDDKIRGLAADILRKINDKRAVAPLIVALKDPSTAVRYRAVLALGDLTDASGADVLACALRDNDEHVRRCAAWALAKLGDGRAFISLVPLLLDTDMGFRRTTAKALATLGDKRAIVPLSEAFDTATDDEFRGVLASALDCLGEPAYRQKLSREAEAKTEREKSAMLAQAEQNRSVFFRNKAQLVEGLSYADVVAMLGSPTQTIGGSSVLGAFGKVSGSAQSIATVSSGMVFVEWKRLEGNYKATFTNGILTELNTWPADRTPSVGRG